EWKSHNSWLNMYSITTKDSFIFSFKDRENIDNYILSRVKNENRAIKNWVKRGPSFGTGDLNTFVDDKKSSCCEIRDYEKPIRETTKYFHMEEFEVFQIIRK